MPIIGTISSKDCNFLQLWRMNFQFEPFEWTVIILLESQILIISREWLLRYEWSHKTYRAPIINMRYLLSAPVLSSMTNYRQFVSNFPMPCWFTLKILQDSVWVAPFYRSFTKMWPAVWEIFRLDTVFKYKIIFIQSHLSLLSALTTITKEKSCKECFRQHKNPLYGQVACIHSVDCRLWKCW